MSHEVLDQVWRPDGIKYMSEMELSEGKFCLDSVSEWGSVYDGREVLFELTVSEWCSVYDGREVLFGLTVSEWGSVYDSREG